MKKMPQNTRLKKLQDNIFINSMTLHNKSLSWKNKESDDLV